MHETPIEDFERQFRLNLRPTYLLCQAALPRMLEGGGGSIVCVSTRAALRPFSGAAGYISSKAAVLAFVDALAAEYTARRRPRQRDPAERDRHARPTAPPSPTPTTPAGSRPRQIARRDPLPVLG